MVSNNHMSESESYHNFQKVGAISFGFINRMFNGVSFSTVSSHTDAIHIGAMEIDGSRMTLPR